MIYSGLVIMLSENELLAKDALKQLEQRKDIDLGERNGRWLPAALEAEDEYACRNFHPWACGMDGIDHIDVVYVHFGETSEATEVNNYADHT